MRTIIISVNLQTNNEKKRLVSILSAIALLNACTKLEEIDQPFHDETINEAEALDTELPEVLYTNMADKSEVKDTVATRTYVENGTVLWLSNFMVIRP